MKTKGWLACLLAAALLLTTGGVWLESAAASDAAAVVTQAPADNRLAGLIPTKGLTDTAWSACNGQVSQLTDGALVLESAHNDTRRVNFYHGAQGGYDRFTFDMGSFYALDRFLLGSEYASGQRVRMVDVYVSDSRDTLYDESHRVVNGVDLPGINTLFTLPAAVRSARYVGLVVPQQQGTMLRLGELGLYGGGAQATVTRLERNRSQLTFSSERYTAWTADVNRLAGRSAYTYNTDKAALGSNMAATRAAAEGMYQ